MPKHVKSVCARLAECYGSIWHYDRKRHMWVADDGRHVWATACSVHDGPCDCPVLYYIYGGLRVEWVPFMSA